MKNLTLGICFLDDEGNVISKRVIGTNWTLDTEQDLKRFPNTCIFDEISAILTENIKLQLTNDVIREMVEEIRDK